MKNISKKTYEKITASDLQPIPAWRFLLKNDLLWAAAIVAGLLGSLAVAAIIHVSVNKEWYVTHMIDRSISHELLTGLPVVWLTVLVLTFVVAHYNVKHSKSGYKYSFYLIALGSLFFSLFFGSITYFIGYGEKVDTYLGEHCGVCQSAEEQKIAAWQHPDAGFLGGLVITAQPNQFILRDPSAHNWTVFDQKARISGNDQLIVPGDELRIVGRRRGPDSFEARLILDWEGPSLNHFKKDIQELNN